MISRVKRMSRRVGGSLLRSCRTVLRIGEAEAPTVSEPEKDHGPLDEKPGYDRIRSVNIGLTGRCNLRCIMCSAGHSIRFAGPARPAGEISELAFERFLQVIGNVDVVSVSGRGEPLLAGDVVEKLKRIRTAAPRARILLTTNGTLLRDKGFIERVMRQIHAVHISANGIHGSYDTIMHGGRFVKLLANVEKIVAAAGRFEHFEELAVGYVVMRRNVQEIARAAKLYRDLGFHGIIYRELSVCDDGLRQESIRYDAGLFEEAREQIRKAEAFTEPDRFFVCSRDLFPEPETEQEAADPGDGQGNPPLAARCSRPWTEWLVDEEGDVRICCIRNTCIGNLNRNDFAEIWTGEEAVRYRKGLLENRPYGHCGTCRILFGDRSENYENLMNREL